jgi:Stage II sporulation protein E (SpoIIE).
MNNTVLLIMPKDELEAVTKAIEPALGKYEIQIILTENALDGLFEYEKYRPFLIITSSRLEQLNGFHLTAIIHDMEYGKDCTMYLITGETTPPEGDKVDCYIQTPIRADLLLRQIFRFFEKKFKSYKKPAAILPAIINQAKLLPQKIFRDSFYVDWIYSSYGDLSGDGLDFWLGQNNDGVYGFLFDCTGHDINSSQQVFEIRTILRIAFRAYEKKMQPLGGVVKNLNDELFCLHGNDQAVVALVVFHLDCRSNVLNYCSAGVPSFFVKNKGEGSYQGVIMKNPLIGHRPKVAFNSQNMSLEGVENIIFSSDGLSDLIFKPNLFNECKHDDVSAIYISLKKSEGD